MKKLYSIEIDSTGLILSTSSSYPYLQEDTLPKTGRNIQECWNDATNELMKTYVEQIFTTEESQELSFKTNRKSIHCIGLCHNPNKAFLCFKYINLEETSENWGFDEISLKEQLVENQPITFYNNLKKFTENLPLVLFEIFLYPDGRFKFGFVNKEMENFFPLFNREAINEDNNLLFFRVHPEDKPKLLDSIKNVFSLNVWDIEYRVIEDGEIRWVRGYGRPEPNPEKNYIKVCTYLQDITEKKKEAEQLKLVDFVFKNANISICFITEDAHFYDINTKAHELLGYTKEEMMGMTVHDLDPNYPAEIWPLHWEELKTNKSAHFETQHRKKDGTLIDVDVNIRLIQFNDFELNCAFVTDITEKKRAEEQLKLVDFVFKNANISICFITEDAHFYDINTKAHELLGYTKEEMMSMTVHDLDPHYQAEIWPLHWEELKTNKSAHFETQHRKKDGTLIDVDVNIRLIQFNDFELNCSFVTDITEKKRAEENLRKISERYEKATSATSDIVWECDFINKTIYFSKNFTSLFGHHVEDGIAPLEDNIWRKNIDPKVLQKIHKKDQIEIKNKSKKWSQEYQLRKADGTYATISDRRIAIRDKNGNVIGLIGSMQDITEKKKIDEERELLLLELSNNNSELTQFNYITTHNLRAPLTNLVSISNLINTDNIIDERTKKLIEAFRTSTYNLNTTMNDLMEILIIKEKPNLSTELLEFDEILETVKSSIEMKILKENVLIKSDFTKVPKVSFSSIYLESIFLNLLTNSIKYRHPDRQPIITIKSSKLANGKTKLVFTDNGIGMNMERVKNKIFGLYQRFHNNPDSKGIGLYLVHSQITTLGGKITVNSQVNKGTTFTLTFK